MCRGEKERKTEAEVPWLKVFIVIFSITIRRMVEAAMGGLTTIWKDRGIKLATKVRLVKALAFPIVLYGADTWTMRKAERKKVDAFEMWCWRRVMGMSWMERNTKVWLLENIKPEWTLESRVTQAALRYFGHVVREERGMENDAMLGEMSGKRRRGRPRTRWLDNVMLREMSGTRR